MAVRKRNWKAQRPNSLVGAFELCVEHAGERLRRPPKALAELLDTPLSTFYRWTSEAAMPAGKIRAFEELCGCHFVSDYLTISSGRMVIDMPSGKAPGEAEIAELQKATAVAITALIAFWSNQAGVDDTLMLVEDALRGFCGQRANVLRAAEPELEF